MKFNRYFWFRDINGLVLILLLVSAPLFGLKKLFELDGALYSILTGIGVVVIRELIADYLKVPIEKE
jgi:hypothetical protein